MLFTQGHALVIGAGTFAHDAAEPIPVATRDAAAVAEILQHPQACGYPPAQVKLVTGAQATQAGILNAFWELMGAGKDDTVLIYFAGHGALGTDDNYYLVSHDARAENGKLVAGTAMNIGQLVDGLRFIPAERVLVVFNVSLATGSIVAPTPAVQHAKSENLPERAGAALVATGKGRMVLTACREQQSSWTGRGYLTVFTQALVDGLRGVDVPHHAGLIDVFGLYGRVYATVVAAAKVMHRTAQEPELTVLEGAESFPIALYQERTVFRGIDRPAQPQGGALRPISEGYAQESYIQIAAATPMGRGGGEPTGAENVDAQNSTGAVFSPQGPVNQQFGNNVNTGGGLYVGGNVNNTGQIANGNIYNITNIQQGEPSTTLVTDKHLIAEPIRLDVASPDRVAVGVTFPIGVAVMQVGSPALEIADLPRVSSEEGEIFRREDSDIVEYRVEVHAPDFQVAEPTLKFRLSKGRNSGVKYFLLVAPKAGRFPVVVEAYQIHAGAEDYQIASNRIQIETFVEAGPT